MVIELFDENEYRETIFRDGITVVGIASKGTRLWRYLEMLLRKLESHFDSSTKVAIADVNVIKNMLQEFETKVAKQRTIIKVFVNGTCIFMQEDVTENVANDIEMLRRGIKDSLRRYSINVRLTVK
ncbi:MAG: hypothetical protein QXJ56_01330 [Ignisphaera sp.]|uniref:Uncharacterized protein n=1 Tax=Ignisphaera aggregans TaxID=334771 RepID=A0A7J3I606_9CREN